MRRPAIRIGVHAASDACLLAPGLHSARAEVPSMNHDASAQVDVPTADDASRVASIRSRLPGQVLRQRIDMAKVCYGPLYMPAEVRRKVGETLPYRLGFIRGAALEPIETYRDLIPDAALLKYDDAVKSGLFSKFWVAMPTYYEERQIDPWILGEVDGAEMFAVIAQW